MITKMLRCWIPCLIAFGDIAFAQVLTISSNALPFGIIGQPYTATLSTSGGTAPYTWGLLSGKLPAGLSLNLINGVISGTPTTIGTSSITVRVSDSSGGTATRTFSIDIANPFKIVLANPLPDAVVGKLYTTVIGTDGSIGSVILTLQAGSLPPGLSIDSLNLLSGTPTSAGTYQFTLAARDATGRTVTQTTSITVEPPSPAPTPPDTTIRGVVGRKFFLPLARIGAGDILQTFYGLASGKLPPGLDFSSDFPPLTCGLRETCEALAGTPTVAGTFVFALRSGSSVKSFSIIISGVLIPAPSLPPGISGQLFAQPLVSGGLPPYHFKLDSGRLPEGLAFDDAGLLTGAPVESGAFTFSVSATDSPTLNPVYPIEFGNVLAPAFTVSQAYRLTISPSPPTPDHITNGASFIPGPISPGEIVTIFGSGLGPSKVATYTLDSQNRVSTSVSGARILFDGIPAPLLYASATQSSAIVPYEVDGKSITKVQVEYGGVQSTAGDVAVRSTAPGLFTVGSGKGQVAALNQDHSFNAPTNPAARGSVLVLYATGEGQTNPPGTSGSIYNASLPKPVLPVSVTIGGVPCEILYAGEAPQAVAGLLQVNILVPDSAPGGSAVPLQLRIGDAVSQLGATVSIGNVGEGTGECSYKLNRNQTGFPSTGGSSTVTLTAGSSCGWTADSTTPWLSVTSGSRGDGNGSVSFTAAPNSGSASRTGTFNIAGQTYYVTQGTAGNKPPTANAVLPKTGNGPHHIFQFMFSDPNGSSDLQIVEVVLNTAFTGAHGCFVRYYAFENAIYLANDPADDYIGKITPGAAGNVGNSQCTVNAASSTVTQAGDGMTLNLDLSFAPSFNGGLTTYGMATDSEGLSAGWQKLGPWQTAP